MAQKKKTVVGVFAHPDDETFGPGGTLALFAKEHEVYIICATSGETATGEIDPKLGEERREELRRSAKILGLKGVFFLSFQDGTLCNNKYHDVADKVKEIVDKLQPEVLITYEPRGVSGHIDHIFMSMVTSFLFPKITSAKKLMKYCLSYERSLPMQGKYFIYYPAGYKKDEIDEVVDVSGMWDTKVKAMYEHKTQLHDVERILEQAVDFPKEEYFLVEEKA